MIRVAQGGRLKAGGSRQKAPGGRGKAQDSRQVAQVAQDRNFSFIVNKADG